MPNVQPIAKAETYRSDVDGLRAVAVLLVVFNHLKTRFTGGYVGVDVFFVISGYLISAHIISAMTAGTFSIVSFYERRIRRILPALLAMLFVVAILCYQYLLPSEMVDTAWSVIAALFSYSNLLFWHQAGYFDGPSALKPLLHTWSLAVEEQFYIFFPVFLLLILRWRRKFLKAAIYIVAATSFGLACFWVRHDASTAFFWAPLRAWELLIGTILSQRYLPVLTRRWQRETASATGLVLILLSSLAFSAQTPFPGLAALAPCIGAGLIIAAGETGSSLICSLLSWRPITFIGLISYSLYLWHWPILVFQNMSSLLLDRSADDRLGKAAVLGLSLVAGAISWRFIETPFRTGRWRPNRQRLFVVVGGWVALTVILSSAMIFSRGMPFRYGDEARKLAAYDNYDVTGAWRQGVCFLVPENSDRNFKSSICLHEDQSKKNYLLFGDSLAADLYPGLSRVFPEINLMQATTAACPPLMVPPSIYKAEYVHNCSAMNGFIYGTYLEQHRPDAVLLAAVWEETDLPELERNIEWFKSQNIPVVVFGPVMSYDLPLPRLLAAAMRDRRRQQLTSHRSTQSDHLDQRMSQLARDKWKVRYISVFRDLCTEQTRLEAESQLEAGGCPTLAAKGVPLLFDEHHFTIEGSIVFAEAIRARQELP